MYIPNKIHLANLPTKIEKLEKLSQEYGKNIYIKRDDQTGIEISGNKIRKLEYAVAEAKRENATMLITCGALQSNHARATAAVANKLNLKSVLVLADGNRAVPNGNYLLDLILGTEIRLIHPDDYARVDEIMNEIKKEYEQKGERAYIIPTGASNAIGMFGYIEAVQEIMRQEKETGIQFDAVVDTVGSTGTYAGLVLGKSIHHASFDIVGFSIADTTESFQKRAFENIVDCCKYLSLEGKNYTPQSFGISEQELKIIDRYRGSGYALNDAEDFELVKYLARLEGIFVDPVYTAKAFRGMLSEIRLAEKGQQDPIASFDKYQNILFIHTGGLYGIFPKAEEMMTFLER